jgi:hypothetical protein
MLELLTADWQLGLIAKDVLAKQRRRKRHDERGGTRRADDR